MHPSVSVKIGSKTLTEADGEVVSATVRRSIGLPIDSCEVRLATGKGIHVKGREDVDVSLGYGGKLQKVFAGSLDKVEYDLEGLTLTALGPCSSLLHLKINRIYSKRTAGEIVKDLCKEAKVSVREAQDGINLPLYALDDKVNAYKHILKLARYCNFDVYTDEDRKLLFKAFRPRETHSLTYGRDIIKATCLGVPKRYEATRIRGESPSSSKGSETVTWFTKKAVIGEVEGDSGQTSLSKSVREVLQADVPAIKDQQTAMKAAKALFEGVEYNLRVTVETVGRPEINLAEAISISGTPKNAMNGDFEVTAVEHYLSKTKGFTTTVTGRRKGELE